MEEESSTKRVSFGQKETLVIDEMTSTPTETEAEVEVTTMNGHVQDSGSNIQTGMESRDNPFTPDGDLSKETEELLRHSTIIRDQFIISQEDEDIAKDSECQNQDNEVKEEVVSSANVHTVQATPNSVSINETQTRKQNGKVDETKPVDKGKAESSAIHDGLNDSTNTPDKKQKKCCAIL